MKVASAMPVRAPAARQLQRGGFLAGMLVGLLVGLALALAVALYVSRWICIFPMSPVIFYCTKFVQMSGWHKPELSSPQQMH